MFNIFGFSGPSKEEIIKEYEARKVEDSARQQRVHQAYNQYKLSGSTEPFIYVEGSPEYINQVLKNK